MQAEQGKGGHSVASDNDGHSDAAAMAGAGGGGGRAVDFASDNPMHNLSLAEFTREMKLDADRQQGLVPIVAKLLLQLVDANDKAPMDKDHITVFHAQKAPAVSVMDYSERIAKYSSCSYCCFVVGVIYMDRFIQQQRHMQKDFHVHSLNVHRILLASVMVAAKFLDDFYYSNEFWAKIGGVPNAELNTLELEFLFMTNFDLHVRISALQGPHLTIHIVQTLHHLSSLAPLPRSFLPRLCSKPMAHPLTFPLLFRIHF